MGLWSYWWASRCLCWEVLIFKQKYMKSIKEMVEWTLIRSVASRNSDQNLYDSILITYGYEVISDYGVVKFISSMTRWRRWFQSRGLYAAKKEVSDARRCHSKRCQAEFKANKKDIQAISIENVFGSKRKHKI